MEKRNKEIFMQSPGRHYLWCLASCCAEQPPVSMGGSVPRYGARKYVCCMGRKQESIFESGVWTYILCNRQSTNFVFRQIIYRLKHRAATWPGEASFCFSAAVTKLGGWTPSLPVHSISTELPRAVPAPLPQPSLGRDHSLSIHIQQILSVQWLGRNRRFQVKGNQLKCQVATVNAALEVASAQCWDNEGKANDRSYDRHRGAWTKVMKHRGAVLGRWGRSHQV